MLKSAVTNGTIRPTSKRSVTPKVPWTSAGVDPQVIAQLIGDDVALEVGGEAVRALQLVQKLDRERPVREVDPIELIEGRVEVLDADTSHRCLPMVSPRSANWGPNVVEFLLPTPVVGSIVEVKPPAADPVGIVVSWLAIA